MSDSTHTNPNVSPSIGISRRQLVVGVALTAALANVATSLARQSTPTAEFVTVDTAFGTVEVPVELTSVVVIEGRRDLDIALSLELPLTGFPKTRDVSAETPMAPALNIAIANGAQPLFVEDEPDIEAIITVSPSLILCRDEDLEDLWDNLSAVAPVLPVGSTGTGVAWQEDLAFIASATSRPEKGDEVLAAYDARFDEVQQTHADVWGTRVGVLSMNEEEIAFLPTRIMWKTLIDLGVTFSAPQAELVAKSESRTYSLEEVQLAVGDAELLVISINEDELFEAWLNDPLWQQVPAVQSGRFVRTDKHTNEGGPITTMFCLDLIDELYNTLG